MKKSFYFALALTAGLFASCSSDEVVNNAPDLGSQVDETAPAPINVQISQANTVVTRGTGTVGDIDGSTQNYWFGQTFNMFMFEKGTFIPAKTVRVENGPEEEICNNGVMQTSKTGDNSSVYLKDGTIETTNYFPGTGQFDFWAYHIDDAGTGANNVGVPAGVGAAASTTYTWDLTNKTNVEPAGFDQNNTLTGEPTTATVGVANTWYKYTDATDTWYVECTAVNTTGDNATKVTVPFVIDGSQDLMVATVDKTAAYGSANWPTTYATDAAKEAKLFSAFTGRRGINPKLVFTHLLTRLTFQIAAGDIEVSTSGSYGTKTIGDGQVWHHGYEVRDITVMSPKTGEIVAAYKESDADALTYTTDAKKRIIWDANEVWTDETTLGALHLKSREKAVEEPAKVTFIEVTSANVNTVSIVNTANNYTSKLGDQFTAAAYAAGQGLAAMYTHGLYKTDSYDPVTGEADGAQYSATDPFTTGTAYLVVYADGFHTAGEGANGEAFGTVTWDKCTYDATATNAIAPMKTLEPVVPGWENETTAAAYGKVVRNDMTDALYAALPDDLKGGPKADASAIDAEALAENEGVYYYTTSGTTNTYYRIEETTHAAGGQLVDTKVGDAILVAPSTADGYVVYVTYYRSVYNGKDNIQYLPNTSKVLVKYTNSLGANEAFEAGKSYNIKIKLQKDGTVESESELTGYEDVNMNNSGTEGEGGYFTATE